MSTSQGAYGGSSGGYGPEGWVKGSRRARSRWSAFEIIAVILGLVVFWPIGLALLGYKFWQQRYGGPDLQTAAERGWRRARAAMAGAGASGGPWSRGFSPTGNSAFDTWRDAEVRRLEDEWRRLETARREFGEFVENVRRAKDREEFERFMNERRGRETP